MNAFFVNNATDATVHVCSLCNAAKNQNTRNGYSNLICHLQAEHPDYKTVLAARQAGGPMDIYIRSSKKAMWIHSWIQLVKAQNWPFE